MCLCGCEWSEYAGRDLLEVDREKAVQALVGFSATSLDRGVWVEGPTARDSQLGGGSGLQVQGGHLSLRDKVGLGDRLPSWAKADRWGTEGEKEGEGSICSELSAGSRHRHPSTRSPRKQFRK